MAKNNFKEFFTLNNAIYMAAVVLAFFVVWQTTIVVLDNYALQQQVDELQAEVDILELENQKLSFNIESYKTDAYLDLAARENFNLKSPGEKVLYVPRTEGTSGSDKESGDSISDEDTDPASNFEQWIDFLFGRESS